MFIQELTKKVNQFFSEILGQKCRVLAMMKDNDQWKATCEVSVDTEYTSRKGLGDLVEIYEVYLDDKLDVTSFKLKQTKRRADIDEER